MTPKIFSAHLREMMERFDPRYHSPIFAKNLERVKQKGWRTIADCCEISNETWDREKLFSEQFPYIEIAAINTDDGVISSVDNLPTAEAPSRAQMVVRSGDILVSTTRPTRNAIARVPDEIGRAIASTGFAVIRDVNEDVVSADYFFHALRFSFCTMQFDQRSSGGNYPAITKDDLRKTIIPIPLPEVQRQIVAELDAAYAAKRKADEKAAQLLASIDDVVLSELGIPKLPPQDTSLRKRMFTVSAAEVFENRMDAVAYQNLRRQFLKNVAHSSYSSIPLGALVDVNRQQTDALNGRQYVGLENIDGTIGDFLPTQDKESLSSAVLFKEGEILFPKLRPYLNKVWLATFDGAASTEFSPLIPTGVSAEYLIVYLRLTQVARVMTLLMTGNTLPRVQLEDVLSLPVPIPSRPVQDRIASTASSIRAEARKLKADATAALDAAKRKIENVVMETSKPYSL